MPRRPAGHLLVRTAASTYISSINHIWISDRQLQDAFNRFTRTIYRRHGSTAPGPLEAQRRLARRRMAGLTMHAPPMLDFGSLFGTNLNDNDRYTHQVLKQQHSLPKEPSRSWSKHRKVITDVRIEKREPLLQALFGREQDEDQEETLEAKAPPVDHKTPKQTSLLDMIAQDARVGDVLHFLRTNLEPYTHSGTHPLIVLLAFMKGKDISDKDFRDYTECVEFALALGVMSLSDLNILLDRIGHWTQEKWTELGPSRRLEIFLQSVWTGLQRCRVQSPDEQLLHKLRLLFESVDSPTSSASQHILEIYRACWSPPEVKASGDVALAATVIHWLDLCFSNEQVPENKNSYFPFRIPQLELAVHHLCRSVYSNSPDCQMISFDGGNMDKEHLSPGHNVIQRITHDLCERTHFLVDVGVTEADRTNFIRRGKWLRALAQSECWRGSIGNRHGLDLYETTASNGTKTRFYRCPTLWFDVMNEICTRLPLQSAVRYMPNLQSRDVCRMALIFSFGPRTSGRRAGMVQFLPEVPESAAGRVRRTASMFEQCLKSSSSEGPYSEYCLLLSAIKSNRPEGHSVENSILVPALRITSIIASTKGHAAAQDFLLSRQFHQVLGDKRSRSGSATSRLQTILKVASMAYPHDKFVIQHNDFARRLWTCVANDTGIMVTKEVKKFASRSTIHREWSRNSYDRLVIHLALHAANDKDVTDAHSFIMVNYFRMQLLEHKLVLLPKMQEAIVLSALIRPMLSGTGVATTRVIWVFNVLRQSGMPHQQLAALESLMNQWHRALSQVRNAQMSQRHLAPSAT